MRPSFLLISVNVLLIGLFGTGLAYHLLTPIYTNDMSHLSYLITAILFVLIALSIPNAFKKDKSVGRTIGRDPTKTDLILKWFSARFMFLGLMGTLWALGMLFRAISIDTGGDSAAMINATITLVKDAGATIFNTSLLGIAAKIWTDANILITEDRLWKKN